MKRHTGGSDRRRLAVGVVVCWPALVTVGVPAVVLGFGPHVVSVFGLSVVCVATVLFARFGLPGLATSRCVECGGDVTLGQLSCPHCGRLYARVHAPLVQTTTAGVLLPIWFLVAEGFLVTVVGAVSPVLPALRPLAELFRTFAFGGGPTIVRILLASAVVPLAVTTVARLLLRVNGSTGTDRPDKAH